VPRLDSCARLHLDAGGRLGSYFGMGLIGTLAGGAVVVGLGLRAGAGATTLAIAVAAPVLSFLFAVKVAHILSGFERIVLYEKFAAALGGSALALHLFGEPVRAGLELVTLGVGTFLVFGRIGCLRVGCCHGRPHRHGIVYGDAHAAAGFPGHLVGVRLFPVQLVESLVTGIIVGMAAVIFAFRHRPGEVVAYYFALYAGARFALELIRGDDDRPHALGLSEAQWIAVGSAWLCALAGSSWGLHLRWFHLGIAVALTAGALAVAAAARGERWRLQQPRALRLLGEALARMRAQHGRNVVRGETPGGLRLSFSEEEDGEHYGLSRAEGTLDEAQAKVIGDQIARLRGTDARPEILAGRTAGVWHVRIPGRGRGMGTAPG
jgi:prolipoprotein diacylglyceryltransferase